MHVFFSAVSWHLLLDSSEPVLCMGQPGRLFRHHIHHEFKKTVYKNKMGVISSEVHRILNFISQKFT